jgi:PKD repeat protein
MRSSRVLTLAAVALFAACGGNNGGSGPSNTAPTAAFSSSCTGLACTFTDASSDPDAGGSVASWDWDFGDNSTHSTDKNPAHPYAQAGDYHVKLVVKDDQSLASAAADSVVTVTAPPAGLTAAFTVSCDGPTCTFTDASTPAGGLTYQWDFGESSSGSANTSTDQNPTHSYTVTTVSPFTVTLTVTDAQSATATTSQGITVTPPAPLQCSGVDCSLQVTQKAILTVTMTSRSCELAGNRFSITAPIQQTVFFNGCSQPVGAQYVLNGPNPDKSFDATTQIEAQFTQGVGDPEDPARGSPGIQLTGSFPSWTIKIDDGGNPTAPGEPDFNDIVLTVSAQTVP